MVNFTSGLIRAPHYLKYQCNKSDLYINPNRIDSIAQQENDTVITMSSGETIDLLNVSAEKVADAFVRANKTDGIANILT